MVIIRIIAGCFIAFSLLSCGGGGSGGSGGSVPTNPPTSVQVLVGAFVDAPVSGLSYATNSQAGITNSAGQFRYVSGEIVRFEFGGIQLGEARAQSILTPLDLFPQQPPLQVALMSFLQTLDADSDLSNGIELTRNIADQTRAYVNEQPGLTTFAEVYSRSDYAGLAGRLTNRSEWIDENDARLAFLSEIDPLIREGRYRPPTGACPVPPNLNNLGPVVQGAYFTDCGEPTQLRTPHPTDTYFHISGAADGQGSTFSICLMPGSFNNQQRYPSGDVTIGTSDQRLVLNENISGNLTINGSRLSIATINGKVVQGNVTCSVNSHNVQFNAECICP
jgi:hypothetical protein